MSPHAGIIEPILTCRDKVLKLQMSITRKLATIGVFGLGTFSVIASIIRMITYLQSTAAEFQPGTDTDSKYCDL